MSKYRGASRLLHTSFHDLQRTSWQSLPNGKYELTTCWDLPICLQILFNDCKPPSLPSHTGNFQGCPGVPLTPVRFHYGSDTSRVYHTYEMSKGLLTQSLPFILLLFRLYFHTDTPRITNILYKVVITGSPTILHPCPTSYSTMSTFSLSKQSLQPNILIEACTISLSRSTRFDLNSKLSLEMAISNFSLLKIMPQTGPFLDLPISEVTLLLSQ